MKPNSFYNWGKNTVFFLFLGTFYWGSVSNLQAVCSEYFMGVSKKDPIMSTVDVTSSPAYSASSTLGTSGCKNWNLAKDLELSQKHFVALKREQILEEMAQGEGLHLEALASLMACPESSRREFQSVLHAHYLEMQEDWKLSPENSQMLPKIKEWTAANSLLQQSCKIL